MKISKNELLKTYSELSDFQLHAIANNQQDHYTSDAREVARVLLGGRNPYDELTKKKKRTTPHPKIKKDTSYIRKHEEQSPWGMLKDFAGGILMIFGVLLLPGGIVGAILIFLMCLHTIIMYLIEKFAT